MVIFMYSIDSVAVFYLTYSLDSKSVCLYFTTTHCFFKKKKTFESLMNLEFTLTQIQILI